MSSPTAGSCYECPVDLTTDEDEVVGVPIDLTMTEDDRCCICLSTVGQLESLGCCRGYCHRGCYQRWLEAVRQREDHVEGVSCPHCRAVRIE